MNYKVVNFIVYLHSNIQRLSSENALSIYFLFTYFSPTKTIQSYMPLVISCTYCATYEQNYFEILAESKCIKKS